MKGPRFSSVIVNALVVVCFLALNALGQTFNARITGTVTDASGASIPSATVSVHEIRTDIAKKTTTGQNGIYDVPLLLPGTYEITIEAPGLEKMIRRDIKLEVNQTITVDFKMTPAMVATVMDVTGDVPMLQTESSGVARRPISCATPAPR